MFTNPKTLAQSALDLLHLSYTDDLSPSVLASVELGAATLCNHVWDWHYAAFGEDDRRARIAVYEGARAKVPSKDGLFAEARDEFAVRYPDWELLRQISNGVKHAKPLISDPTQTVQREVEWGDADFWSATHNVPTLFVEVSGRHHSVSSLIRNFADAYIAAPPPLPTHRRL